MRVAVAIGLTVGERTMLYVWSKGGATPARFSLKVLIRCAFVDEHHAIAKTFVWAANADAILDILDIPNKPLRPSRPGSNPIGVRHSTQPSVRSERRALR